MLFRLMILCVAAVSLSGCCCSVCEPLVEKALEDGDFAPDGAEPSKEPGATVSPSDHTTATDLPMEAPPNAEALRHAWFKSGHPSQRKNEIPQLRDMWTMFNKAAPATMDVVEQGLMLCDVRLSESSWNEDEDLTVTLTLGNGRPMKLRGEEDSHTTIVGAPVARLSKGDPIKAVIVDRDILFDDDIDTATTTWSGIFPMVFVSKQNKARLTCQLVPAATVQANADPLFTGLEGDLARLQGHTPDPQRGDWGCAPKVFDAHAGRLYTTVAWLGWEHTRVKEFQSQFTQARMLLTEACVNAVAEAHANLPEVGTALRIEGTGWEVAAQRASCGPPAQARQEAIAPEQLKARCVIEVAVRNVGDAPRTLPTIKPAAQTKAPSGLTLKHVNTQGRVSPLRWVGYADGAEDTVAGAMLQPGESRTVLLGSREAASGQLIQVSSKGRPVRARLPVGD